MDHAGLFFFTKKLKGELGARSAPKSDFHDILAGQKDHLPTQIPNLLVELGWPEYFPAVQPDYCARNPPVSPRRSVGEPKNERPGCLVNGN
jgi:hypothetical protein